MIGNDIIDLSQARKQSNLQRKGFLEKLFSDNEKKLILNSISYFDMIWMLWSMKEAAYKIYTQQHNIRFFAPKKFECKLTNEFNGVICIKGQNFYSNSIINPNFIFTIAILNKKKKSYSEITSPDQIDIKIKSKLNELTGLNISAIKQKKSKNGAPRYYYKKKLLTSSCSITHHGDYGAYSFVMS